MEDHWKFLWEGGWESKQNFKKEIMKLTWNFLGGGGGGGVIGCKTKKKFLSGEYGYFQGLHNFETMSATEERFD